MTVKKTPTKEAVRTITLTPTIITIVIAFDNALFFLIIFLIDDKMPSSSYL
ncbi:unnamed protein product [marine sediment metagenome]|uniref:Uncharacterized protein n=1 Tax=marine sediment metagenome TaxID=412755 RepID=X1AZP0_9ZZZZ